MQLQSARHRFEAQGITLAAVSYDNPAILKDFATRHKIDFPLLVDPDSRIISSFGVLNSQATGMNKGMAVPGYFFIDSAGVVREKFFQSEYADRVTPNNLIAKLFPELAEEAVQKIDAPHLGLELTQSDRVVSPGNRFTVVAQIVLPPDVHVYAPGVKGYKPIALELAPSPEFQISSPVYPPSKTLFLDAIKEQVPVFEGKFRITSDVMLAATPEFMKSLGATGKSITLTGQLKYQACDKTTCYLPAAIPVTWQLQVLPLDLQRAPESVQHK